ncbi:unnamed protein product [Anisakis simplex]|uniref:Uncharacterized protein n=1 Tax=Anisakis simplex TaxID=6269 RepID=A0A3P6NK55_ANISI|nr:unnamed protein product [Anisakis simplex]
MGQLAAMLYAVIGIPLVLMILHKLGRQFLIALEYFWNWMVRSVGGDFASYFPIIFNYFSCCKALMRQY